MRDALSILNRLQDDGVLGSYAIGGAMAAMFYAEPVTTFDLDVFVVLPQQGALLTLNPIYDALRAMGYAPHGEDMIIEGVPVQFLPAPTALVEEALAQARMVEVEGVNTRVFRVEHLIAIAVQTNRPKDRDRVAQLLEQARVDKLALEDICRRHGLTMPDTAPRIVPPNS